MGERISVTVDDGITDKLIELAGSSRKQGEFVTKMISEAYEGRDLLQGSSLDVESLRLQVLGLAGQQKAVEGRVQRLESQVAAIIAQQGKNAA